MAFLLLGEFALRLYREVFKVDEKQINVGSKVIFGNNHQ